MDCCHADISNLFSALFFFKKNMGSLDNSFFGMWMFGWILSSFYSHNISWATGCSTTTKIIKPSSFNGQQEILLDKCFTSFSPKIFCVVVAKQFSFDFINSGCFVSEHLQFIRTIFFLMKMKKVFTSDIYPMSITTEQAALYCSR